MMLILIQRGRGGGITGALGGAGGQSAFGSKTGDVFTKITVYTAITWIMLSILTISCINQPDPPTQIQLDRMGGTGELDNEMDLEAPDALPLTDALDELPATELPTEDELPNQQSGDEGQTDDAGEATDPPLEQPPVTDGAEGEGTESGTGDDSANTGDDSANNDSTGDGESDSDRSDD